jgi:hypothetical protein
MEKDFDKTINDLNKLAEEWKQLADSVISLDKEYIAAPVFMAAAATYNYDPNRDRAFDQLRGIK